MPLRRVLFIIGFILAAIVSAFAMPYQIVCKSSLNVREYPSAGSRKIGSLNNNTIVDVVQINANWAEIRYGGKTAYISADYTQPVAIVNESPSSSSESASSGFISSDFISSKINMMKSLGDTSMLLWGLVPAFLLFYIFRRRIDEDGEWLDVRYLAVSAVAISVMEFVYATGSQNFTWFCSEPRWYWIVVNFIVFGVLVFQQLMAYTTFTGCASDGNGLLSIYSWPVCLVLGVILYFCDVDTIYAIVLLLVAQLIQTGIIFYTLYKYRSFTSALFYSVVYLIFTVSTAMILLQFIAILIIVLIGFVVLMALSSGSSSSSGERSSQSYDTPRQSDAGEEKYTTPDGWDLHYDGFGDWHDDRGRHYHNTGAWGGRDMVRTDDD